MSSDDSTLLRSLLAALEAAGDLAYAWDLGKDTIHWHGAAKAIPELGDLGALGTGRRFAERIHSEDVALRRNRLDAHLARGEVLECEYRICGVSGASVWVQDRGAAERDAEGRPVRLSGVLRLITGRKLQEQRLEQLANYDELTGHFNKTRLCQALDHIVAASLRTGLPGAFLAVGVDKLATINDAFGYEAADQVIVEIARRLDRYLRVSDVIGRVGGDRFGIVLAACPEHNVASAAEKVLGAVSRSPIATSAGLIYATVSIGSATFPDQAKTSHEVMARAETALADAKRAGRDCFVPYRLSETQRRQQRTDMALGESVQRALKESRLAFAYQPVVDSSTGAVDYYECLLRMISEDGNVVAAGTFVPVIEQLGFVRLLDRHVLERVVEEATRYPNITLGFNISGLTATDRSWLRAVVSLLEDKPAIARRLIVEITETAALADIEESARFVDTLKALGCRVALDDFGAGFTSLRHLQALAVDVVKIDGSFVRDLADSYDNQIFLRHLVGLADGFGLITVAESVESAREAAILRREGVAFLQGYHFGRPSIERPWLEAKDRLSEPLLDLRGAASARS